MNIPGGAIYRRFRTGLWNMIHLYLPLANEAEIYDNSDRKRVLIAEKRKTESLIVLDTQVWIRIEEAIQ